MLRIIFEGEGKHPGSTNNYTKFVQLIICKNHSNIATARDGRGVFLGLRENSFKTVSFPFSFVSVSFVV